MDGTWGLRFVSGGGGLERRCSERRWLYERRMRSAMAMVWARVSKPVSAEGAGGVAASSRGAWGC